MESAIVTWFSYGRVLLPHCRNPSILLPVYLINTGTRLLYLLLLLTTSTAIWSDKECVNMIQYKAKYQTASVLTTGWDNVLIHIWETEARHSMTSITCSCFYLLLLSLLLDMPIQTFSIPLTNTSAYYGKTSIAYHQYYNDPSAVYNTGIIN